MSKDSPAIRFHHDLEDESFRELTDRLRELAGSKTETYVARALNKTATSARQRLSVQTRLAYTIKAGAFKSDMKITKASADKLEAEISSEGAPESLKDFKHRFSRPSPAKVDIIRTGLKAVRKYDNKAFVGTGKANGHIYVRTGKKQSGNSKRDAIEKLFSKSVPYMIGSDRVYGEQKPLIEADLKKFMDQQIRLLIQKKGGAVNAE